ncbi:hypothetical protein EDD11_006062 [Mortierella claussenii]|nr:hypothetical protein EDD11_006062 [Mortierella claussenii]
MDLLFVQEDRLSIVFTTLFKNGLHMALDQDLGNTPPDSPIQDNLDPMKREMHDIMNKDHHTPGMIEGIEKAPPSYAVGDLQVKHVPVNSLATPPGSRNSTYMSDGTDDGDIDENIVSDVNLVHASAQQLMPLDIISAQRRGRGAVSTENYQEEEYSEAQLPKASPTTATTLELRQQANRTLPLNTLRCVGLNTDLEAAYQPWILKIIKILFYHDKVKDEAVCAGRGPTHDAPRFFSFTATSECVSMITDTYILEEFEEHELFMDNETCPLRLIQLDLHRFGLDKYGIIHSVARPLTEAGIELLYLSTFSTANILVAEHRLSDAERILSGSGANLKNRGVVTCAGNQQLGYLASSVQAIRKLLLIEIFYMDTGVKGYLSMDQQKYIDGMTDNIKAKDIF